MFDITYIIYFDLSGISGSRMMLKRIMFCCVLLMIASTLVGAEECWHNDWQERDAWATKALTHNEGR